MLISQSIAVFFAFRPAHKHRHYTLSALRLATHGRPRHIYKAVGAWKYIVRIFLSFTRICIQKNRVLFFIFLRRKLLKSICRPFAVPCKRHLNYCHQSIILDNCYQIWSQIWTILTSINLNSLSAANVKYHREWLLFTAPRKNMIAYLSYFY